METSETRNCAKHYMASYDIKWDILWHYNVRFGRVERFARVSNVLRGMEHSKCEACQKVTAGEQTGYGTKRESSAACKKKEDGEFSVDNSQ